MAPRSYWKGYLKLSLVTCRVEMMPARTSAEQVRFRAINRQTGNRVTSTWVDSVTGKPVAEKDEARGYERAEDDYVLFEDEDFDRIALESTRTIAIDSFVPRDSIAWIWRNVPHYLLPADKVSTKAYAVIRDAMAATGMVGIARLVLGGRERAVMLEAREGGIVLWSLYFAEELRDPDPVFPDNLPGPDKPALALIRKLIDKDRSDWNPAMVHDPMQETLLEMVEEKRKGLKKKRAATKKDDGDGKVINIMDALKRSLEAEKKKR